MSKKDKKKRKKRVRRLDREGLRTRAAPTKDFEFVNPNDPDDILLVTAQKLSPGHLLNMDSSSLIRAYRQKPPEQGVESDTENEESSEQESSRLTQDILDNFNTIVSNIQYASEIASMSIIDPETGKTIYTKEDCMLYLLPNENTEIANWALSDARPIREGDDADGVDNFSVESGQQAEPELEEQTE